MSMNSSFIYGYGFPCDCKDENLVKFILAHKKTFCQSESEIVLHQKLVEATKENSNMDLEDFFTNYECDMNGLTGLGAIIANIMSRETGIHFLYSPSDDSCSTPNAVVFEVSYPWQLNDIERALTEEQLTVSCKTYMQELGIQAEPDYLALEHFG